MKTASTAILDAAYSSEMICKHRNITASQGAPEEDGRRVDGATLQAARLALLGINLILRRALVVESSAPQTQEQSSCVHLYFLDQCNYLERRNRL